MSEEPVAAITVTDHDRGAGVDASRSPVWSQQVGASRIEQWLGARRRLIVLLIVISAALVRLICFAQYLDSPAVAQHAWAQSDMHFFDRWAKTLVAGDWMLDRPLHPIHRWHEQVADAWFRDNPDVLRDIQASTTDDGASNTPAQVLWDRWYGEKRFHQEPLYPYLLAIVYELFSPEVRIVVALQMMVGVATTLLIYLLTRRLGGELAGVLSGALAVLCPLLPYYETLLLRESLIVFATVALLMITDVALARPRRWVSWAMVGAVVGAAMLLKSTFALYGAVVIVGLLWTQRRTPRDAAMACGAFVAGAALALAPVMVRNMAVGVGPLDLSSVGAATFAASNAPGRATSAGFVPEHERITEILGRADGSFGRTVGLTLRSHPGPSSVLRLLAGKVAWTFLWAEVPNNSSFYYYELRLPVLRWLPVRYATLAALALVGVVIGIGTRPQRDRLWPAYAMLITALLVLLAFDVSSRLRMPVVAALFPFAGIGLAGIVQALSARRWIVGSGAIILAGALWLVIQRPMPSGLPLIRTADFGVPLVYHYAPQIEQATRRGDLNEAFRLYDQALTHRPPYLDAGATSVDLTSDEQGLAERYAAFHARYAAFLRLHGHDAEADDEAREAQRIRALASPTTAPAP